MYLISLFKKWRDYLFHQSSAPNEISSREKISLIKLNQLEFLYEISNRKICKRNITIQLPDYVFYGLKKIGVLEDKPKINHLSKNYLEVELDWELGQIVLEHVDNVKVSQDYDYLATFFNTYNSTLELYLERNICEQIKLKIKENQDFKQKALLYSKSNDVKGFICFSKNLGL